MKEVNVYLSLLSLVHLFILAVGGGLVSEIFAAVSSKERLFFMTTILVIETAVCVALYIKLFLGLKDKK